MTEELILFLKELALLMEKHGVEIEAEEYSGYSGGGCDGITFILDKNVWDSHTFSSKYLDAEDVEKLLHQKANSQPDSKETK